MQPTLFCLSVTLSALFAEGGDVEAQPNVIVVMADDISAREFKVYGSDSCTDEWAATPVIDRLAREGCYLKTVWASTVCMPSRAMVMTGRYAHRTKWWDNGQIGRGPLRGAYSVPEGSSVLMADVAEQAGYRSMWVGKTHCTSGSNVRKFRFDEGLFSPGDGDQRGAGPHEHFRNVRDPEFWNYHSYLWWPEIVAMNHPAAGRRSFSYPNTEINDFGPDIEMEAIFDFIERSKDEGRPFFVKHDSHLGHRSIDMASENFDMTWVGTPRITWDVATQTYTRHQPTITPDGPVNTVGTKYDKENITPNRIKHHLEYLDYQLWQYVTKLKQLSLLNNTVLIFTADNATLGWKGSIVRQRGVHVPFVVYAPGKKDLVQGEQNVISDLSDLLPTLADIMGSGSVSATKNVVGSETDGKSLWPYLTGQSNTHRDWIYAYKGNKQIIRGQQLMRDGDGNWWDVSETPRDLDSFTPIPGGAPFPEDLFTEKAALETKLTQFAREDIDGPNSYNASFDVPANEQDRKKMRGKAAAREERRAMRQKQN